MSIVIPNVETIPSGNYSTAKHYPVKTVDNGDSTYTHTFGFPYRGGKSTIAFYGNFGSGTQIRIQAAFDGGQVTNGTESDTNEPANFINLTDSQGNSDPITANGIFTVDIGKCMLRFEVSATSTTGPINVSIS